MPGFLWKDTDLRRAALSRKANALLLTTTRRVAGKIRTVMTLVDAGSGHVLHRVVDEGEDVSGAAIFRAVRLLSVSWDEDAGRRDLPGLRSEPTTATKSEAARDYLLAGDDLTKKRNEENFNRGVECYRKAVAADPQCALAAASLASALAMRQQFRPNPGELEESIQLAKRAVAQDPLLPDAQRARAVTLTMAGRYPEAEEASIRAFELDPTYQRAPGLLGALANLSGRPDRALRWYGWARRMQNQPGEYAVNIAGAWLVLGEHAAAETALREGAEFRPDLPDAIFLRITIALYEDRRRRRGTPRA